MLPTAWCDHMGNVLISIYYYADGSRPKTHTRTVFTTFNGNTMKRDRFFHILKFLHFNDNKNEPHMTEPPFKVNNSITNESMTI
jgi:hypothetical protein